MIHSIVNKLYFKKGVEEGVILSSRLHCTNSVVTHALNIIANRQNFLFKCHRFL